MHIGLLSIVMGDVLARFNQCTAGRCVVMIPCEPCLVKNVDSVTCMQTQRKPATDCLWLYVTGNHYQLVGPMQQPVVMKAATSTGKDKDFVLAPHGMRCKPCMSNLHEQQDQTDMIAVMVHVWQSNDVERVILFSTMMVYIGYVVPGGAASSC